MNINVQEIAGQNLQQYQSQLMEKTGAFVSNNNGHVSITTTPGNDQIKAWQVGTIVKISLNGREPICLDSCAMKSLSLQGAGGNDTLTADSSLIFPIQIKDCKKVDAITVREQQLGGYLQIVQGRVPQPIVNAPGEMSRSGDLPSPACQNPVQQSNQNLNIQMSRDNCRQADEKTKKLEKLLDVALASGDIDLAVLLLSSIETKQANESASKIMTKIKDLQQQRAQVSDDLGKLGSGSEDGAKTSALNNQAGGIASDISMLQTMLQEATSRKQEAQQLASNMMKSVHDTNQSILRNMA